MKHHKSIRFYACFNGLFVNQHQQHCLSLYLVIDVLKTQMFKKLKKILSTGMTQEETSGGLLMKETTLKALQFLTIDITNNRTKEEIN